MSFKRTHHGKKNQEGENRGSVTCLQNVRHLRCVGLCVASPFRRTATFHRVSAGFNDPLNFVLFVQSQVRHDGHDGLFDFEKLRVVHVHHIVLPFVAGIFLSHFRLGQVLQEVPVLMPTESENT